MHIPGPAYPGSELVIDPMLIRQYDLGGPRYTSYPTADRFSDAFREPQFRQGLERRNIGGVSRELSVYFHLPFCATLCYFCACNRVVTRDRRKSSKYIKHLEAEMAAVGGQLRDDRKISQLHWGGGTPTFLAREEMQALMAAFDAQFSRSAHYEGSIEVDPRSTEPGTMAFLAALGFTRLSVGVQDFDSDVQKAVHRVQSEEDTGRVIAEARENGFRSVNLDLIYGLPKQTLDSFNRTLDRVLALNPDRIVLYGYAHLPQRFAPQRRISQADLPGAETKLQIMTLAIGRLTRAGYVYIGMDHFARPHDELAVAQSQGRLLRDFQGYTTRSGDLLGFGASSIGRIGPAYYQNCKQLEDYYAALDAGRLPVERGIELTPDDLVRAAVIQALICQFRLSVESIELAHLLDFQKYFARELAALRTFAQQGLVELERDWITVTPKGRLLVRAICMVFDRYLQQARERAAYSRIL